MIYFYSITQLGGVLLFPKEIVGPMIMSQERIDFPIIGYSRIGPRILE